MYQKRHLCIKTCYIYQILLDSEIKRKKSRNSTTVRCLRVIEGNLYGDIFPWKNK